ncbi:MAG: fimbrillin family protein, partial [Bacteroidales bacterium]|nr:fimbrillin family protein [Bacteroidales bacterium]
FSHILANIRFNFVREDGATDEYTVTKVTLAGFLPNGSCSVTGTSTGLTPVTWTVGGTPTKTLEKEAEDLPNDGKINAPNPTLSLNDGDGIYVLPQNASSIECTIEYTIGSGSEATEKTATGNLPELLWAKNKIYTYKVILAGDDAIIFATPTVEPWGEELNSGAIVIQ